VSQIVRIVRQVSGVGVDADAVTLRNQANTAAITRVRDGAIIVTPAQANAVESVGDGAYEYDVEPHALDPSESYLIWFYFVAAGYSDRFESETIQAADTSRTRRGYRRAVMESGRLGRYRRVTISETADPDDDSDALKRLICASLINPDRDESFFNTAFAFVASGAEVGEQRRVKRDSFINTAGSLLVVRDYDAPIEAGTVVEFLWRLPADSEDGMPGVHDLINRALDELWTIDRIPLTTVANQRNYSLSDYPWLNDQDQIGSIYGPIADAETENPRRWLGGGHIRPDADVGVLELDVPFSTDDETFWLEVARPDKRWIKSGGAWGSSNVGLQAEDDEALADPRLVTEFVLAFAFEALIGQAADDAEARHWEKAAATQHTKAAALRSELLDKLDRSGRGVGKRPRVQNTARWVSRIPSRRFGR
jgi:hypothetical protein